MGMYDALTGTYTDFSYGLDVHAATAAEPSIYESVSNFVTKGAPLTGLSILNSFANTAIDVGNFFGLENQRLSIEDQVSGDMLDYYTSHKQGIEGAGLVIGSLIPGGLAVKGANAAVKAAWLARSGYSTETLSRATGLLAPLKAKILQNAQQEIAIQGSLYNGLNADKLKLIGLGLGDQALQSLVYEVATVATMKASPLLDADGLKEVVHNTFSGMIVGGVIGGAIEGAITSRLLKKMMLKSEADTKINELATHLGIGDHLPGDRAAAIINSLYELPEATTALAAKKQATTRDTATLAFRKMLNEAAGPGEENVSNALADVILDGIRTGLLTRDDVVDKLSRLTKVTRIDDVAGIEVPTGDTFFINKFVGEGRGRARPLRGIDEVITSAAHPGAADSRRYKLADGVTQIEIAHASDMIELPTGLKIVKYTHSKEAFEDGADMFIGKRGDIVLNRASTKFKEIPGPGENRILTAAEKAEYAATGKLPADSKPLLTEPITLNVITKNMSTRHNITPVVGDYGAPALVDKGLVYGDKFSAQNVGNLITASTEPLEANARFVWAQKKGFDYQDKVNVFDIARMEALYNKFTGSGLAWPAFVEQQTKRGMKLLTAEGEIVLPSRADDFITMLRDGKDRIITEALEKSGVDGAAKRSTTDIARMANVPEDYILSGMQSYDVKNFTVNVAQHERINHINMIYDLDNVLKDADGNIARGMLDVQYRVSLAQEAAKTALAKEFGPQWERFVIGRGAAEATTEGAGGGLVTSANAGYGSFGQKFERSGREVEILNKARNQAIHDALLPHAEVLKNSPALSAEVGNFVNVRRRTSEDYVFLPVEIGAKFGRNADTVVLKGSLIRDRNGRVVDWNTNYVPEGFLPAPVKIDFHPTSAGTELHTFYDLSPQAAAFERANQTINRERIASRENWWSALGMRGKHDPEVLYAPPIDTGKYPFFFFVKPREGTAFANESPAVVTANTAAELKSKAALMDTDRYQVIYKSENKAYREALGDYEYDRNFSASLVNSDLRKKGVLNDIFPDIRADSILRDYVDFHARQNLRLIRDYVELGNAQLFAELRAMGSTATAAETSRTGFTSSLLGKTAPNPFNSYINTALAIRDRGNYKLWGDSNELLESFASTAFNTAKQAFGAAKRGVIPFEEAAKMSESFGLGNVYGAATDAMKGYDIANRLPPQRYLSQWISTAHSIISATAIRLDAFQSLINAVSTPVLALAEARSAIGRGSEMLTTTVPGTNQKVPAVTKLLANGVTSFATNDADKQFLMPMLREIGAVRNASDMHQAMLSDLALPLGTFKESEFVTKMRGAVDKGSKLLGADLSEEMSRYVPGYMAYKIFGPEGKGLVGQELKDNIVTFVNRVQGNYTASQRPLLFQGPLGSAIGLFQTYQFNLMQQVFRYIENGEGKSLALLAGMQTSLFGLQGLPGFQMINNHIVGNAAGNPQHKDIYSTVPNLMDKKTGDYLLYGVLSNWMNAGLYTRGDINPRQATIIPINPMDFPAISGATKLVTALAGASETIAAGGSVPASLLLGLEHNGLSRPLAGIAQLIQGFSTTGKGALVAATGTGLTAAPSAGTMGWSEMFSMANFSRLAGARPLDEAVVMDAMYRKTLYTAKDATRISALGEAVKTHLYNHGTIDSEQLREFGAKYAAAGGDIASFGRKINEWTRDSNVSTANKIYTSLRQGNMQQIQMMMGGQRLPDFRNIGGIDAAPIE